MFKAVLIDDEKIVIEGLRKLIKWEKFGFELIGCYTDGIDGAANIRKIRPDLVISDIRMPGLDGFSMIEQVKNELPYTVFLIISGYTDFQYARKALNLGVSDYIDKPITIEKVTAVLERVRKICEDNKVKQEKVKQVDNINKNVLEKSILEFMHSDDTFEAWFMHLDDDQRKKIGELYSFCVISGFIKNYLISCDNIVESIFESYFTSELFTYLTAKRGETFTGVILCRDSNVVKADIYKLISKCKAGCSKASIDIMLGVSQIYSSPDKLRCSYIESIKSLRYAIFKSAKEMYIYDSNNYRNNTPIIRKLDQEPIFQNLRIMDVDMVIKELKDYLSMLVENELSPDVFCEECMKLIYKAMNEARCVGYDIEYQAVNAKDIHEEIQLCRSYQAIIEWTISAFKQILQHMIDVRDGSIYKPIMKIKDYLQHNFQKDISLNDVARNVGFNPAYLSVLFKEEAGMSFIKYLTCLRLDYAKKMLEEGYKVVDVSKKSGYNNYRYFCDTFKKYIGMTPNEYKGYGATSRAPAGKKDI